MECLRKINVYSGLFVAFSHSLTADCVKTALSNQAIGFNYANLQYKLALLNQNRQKIKMLVLDVEM